MEEAAARWGESRKRSSEAAKEVVALLGLEGGPAMGRGGEGARLPP